MKSSPTPDSRPPQPSVQSAPLGAQPEPGDVPLNGAQTAAGPTTAGQATTDQAPPVQAPNAEPVGWIRARRPEHKQLRREAILQAARELLEERGLEGAVLTAIAQRARISRANLYRYFDSREAILLELLLGAQDLWMTALEGRLADQRGPQEVAAAFSGTLTEHPQFCLLVGTLAQQLEQHLSQEDIQRFHRNLVERTDRLMPLLEAALPQYDARSLRSGLATLVMAAGGIWPYCHPAPAVARVLEEPPFRHLRFDFETTVRQLAETSLRGLPTR